MRILVSWAPDQEAELISLYLNTAEHTAEVVHDPSALLRQATEHGPWDVVLLAIDHPGLDEAFTVFQELRKRLPHCPLVGACRSGEVMHLARFLMAGLRTYVLRDTDGDFVFLLLSTLESTVEAVRAERDQHLAEKLRDEVDAVRRFEQAMIDEELFCPAGYAIAGRYEPSAIRVRGGSPVVLAGGDFYDVFPLDRSHTALVMADASGHGMQACLSVTILQTFLDVLKEQGIRRSARVATELNRRFCAHRIVRKRGNLCTLFFGILHHRKGRLDWISAGHPQPLLEEQSTGRIELIGEGKRAGPPLGVDEEILYHEVTTFLPPRSRLVLYTDGLTEASPAENSSLQFGLDGMRHTLRRMAERSAEDVVQALLTDSQAFTRGAGRHDDASVLVLQRV